MNIRPGFYNSGHTPLHESLSMMAKGDCAELLVARGASVNALRPGDSSPLHEAAYMGRLHAVKLLVARGATVDARDCDLRTPLHKAAWQGRTEVVKFLLAQGADAKARDLEGRDPVAWALRCKHKRLAELLRKQ